MNTAPCRRPTSRVLVLSAHSMALDRRIVVEMNSLVARGREVCLVTVPTDLPAEVMDPRILVVGRHQTKDHTYLVSGHCRDGEFRAQSRELPPGVAERIRNAAPSGDLTALYQWFGNYFPILAEGLRNFGLAPRPFDAIHCHDLETLAPALRIRDKLHPGAKLIYDAHELYPYCVPDWHHQSFWSGIELRLIGQADAVITVSDSFADLLASLYHIPKPTVLHNSYGALGEEAHVGEVEFLAHFGAPTGGKRIVFQGGLNQSRNVETLIRGFAHLPPDHRLFLFLPKDAVPEVQRIKAELGLANVFPAPWVPQHLLLGYLRHVHLGVVPYKEDGLLNHRYCMPNKVFEFLRVGVPICANLLLEVKKIVEGYGVGRVYELNTPERTAQAVADCLARRERGEFPAAGFARALADLEWPVQEGKLLALYASLGV